MAVNKKAIVAIGLFLVLITPALAQGIFGEGIGETIINIGTSLHKILQDDKAMLVIMFILFYLILYSIFSVAGQRVRLLQGEGGRGLSGSARLMGHAFAGLCCLGIFAFKDTILNDLPGVLGTFGLYGGLAIGGIVYATVYQAIKSEPSIMGANPKFAALVPALIAFMLIATITGIKTMITLASIAVVIVVVGLIIKLFGKIFGGKSAKKEAKAKKEIEVAEHELDAEERRIVRNEEFLRKSGIYEGSVLERMDQVSVDEDQTVLHAKNAMAAITQAAEELGINPNDTQIAAKALQLTEQLEGLDHREDADVKAVEDSLTKVIQQTKLEKESIDHEIDRIGKKIDKLKRADVKIKGKDVKTADHVLLQNLRDEINMLRDEAERLDKVEDLEKALAKAKKEQERSIRAEALLIQQLKPKIQNYANNPTAAKLQDIKKILNELNKAGALIKREGETTKDMVEELSASVAETREISRRHEILSQNLGNKIRKLEYDEESGVDIRGDIQNLAQFEKRERAQEKKERKGEQQIPEA